VTKELPHFYSPRIRHLYRSTNLYLAAIKTLGRSPLRIGVAEGHHLARFARNSYGNHDNEPHRGNASSQLEKALALYGVQAFCPRGESRLLSEQSNGQQK
jgi:hypothetical protein